MILQAREKNFVTEKRHFFFSADTAIAMSGGGVHLFVLIHG